MSPWNPPASRLRVTATPIETVDVEQHEVLATAEASGLTAYDASYLWLARRLGVGLITLDRQLAAAMVATQR